MGEKVWLRFGEIPESGRSFNHIRGDREAGVAAFDAERVSRDYYRIEGVGPHLAFVAAAKLAIGCNLYEVQGTEAGRHPYGEPLIAEATETFIDSIVTIEVEGYEGWVAYLLDYFESIGPLSGPGIDPDYPTPEYPPIPSNTEDFLTSEEVTQLWAECGLFNGTPGAALRPLSGGAVGGAAQSLSSVLAGVRAPPTMKRSLAPSTAALDNLFKPLRKFLRKRR